MEEHAKLIRPHIAVAQLDAEEKHFICANCEKEVVFRRHTGNVIHNKDKNFCSERCMNIYLDRGNNE